MSVSELTTRIEQTAFGASLSPLSRQKLAAMATHVRLGRGEVLFREGTHNANLYLVLAGQVDLAMTVPGRGTVRILSVGPGEIVAWSAVLGEGRMTCSATAADDSELLAVPAPQLAALMSSEHEVGYEFMRVLAAALAKRLVATRLQLLDLFAAEGPLIDSTPARTVP